MKGAAETRMILRLKISFGIFSGALEMNIVMNSRVESTQEPNHVRRSGIAMMPSRGDVKERVLRTICNSSVFL